MKRILVTAFVTALVPVFAQWNEITSPYAGNLSAIKFFDDNTGYIGGNTVILKTMDGGDSWTSTPISIFSINGFSFPSGTVGYFGANNSTIGKTTDQGVNWVNLDPGVSPYAFLSVNFPTTDLGYGVGSAGIIRKTIDGGTTWATQTSGTTSNLREVYFFNTTSGIIIGESGTIKRTNNGGSNWITVTSGTTSHLNDIHFVNASTGFIAGGNGVILKTNDGGFSWNALTSGTTEWLHAVCFKNMLVGYVAGAGGTILKTTDGGVTWTPEASGLTTDNIVNDMVYLNGHFMVVTSTGKILTNEFSSNIGINEIAIDEFSVNVFPNPAADFVSISFTNTSETPISIDVFNTNGALVKSESVTEKELLFNVENWMSGVYVVRITTSNAIIDKKLVIQK